MRIIGISIFLALLSSLSVASDVTVYEMTVKGKVCKEESNQLLSCQYKVGNDLHISLDGIGAPDTGITFIKSNSDGDFYATYGIRHGCVIVKSRPYQGYSFISPKNGRIYKGWRECQSGY